MKLFWRRRVPVIALLWMAVMISCARKEDNTLRDAAQQLYSDSRDLLKAYTDSMAQCGDSAFIERVDANFERNITAINFKYPPNTYLEISEDENDTIAQLTGKYTGLRDSMLYRLAHPLLIVDTLVIDTISKANTH